MASITLHPNGAGLFTEWQFSSASNWQDAGDSTDVTWVETVNIGARDLYAFDNLPANAVTVSAVIVTIRWGGGSGIHDFIRFYWSDGGNDAQTGDFTIPGPAANQSYTITQHPGGGSWTPATVNSAQFGFVMTDIEPTTLALQVFDIKVDVTYDTTSGRVFGVSGNLNGLGGQGAMNWDPLG